ncbi:MAG: c-type cytochrome [Pseudomonadales bacterium]
MKKTLLAVNLCLLTTATLAIANRAQAEGDPQAGKTKAAQCVACHGADGNSLAAAFPKIAGQGEKYLLKQMQEIKEGVRPIAQMAGQLDNMSDQDLQDIASYYAGQTMSGSAAKKDLVDMGASVYRAGIKKQGIAACTGCHSPTGVGNAPAGFPRLSGQHADYIEQQLLMFQTGERNNDVDSVMRSITERMTAKEIKAVSSYASGVR